MAKHRKLKILLIVTLSLIALAISAVVIVFILLARSLEFKPDKDLAPITKQLRSIGAQEICSHRSGSGSGDGSASLQEATLLYKVNMPANQVDMAIKERISPSFKFAFDNDLASNPLGSTPLRGYILGKLGWKNYTRLALFSDSVVKFDCTTYPITQEKTVQDIRNGVNFGPATTVIYLYDVHQYIK